MSQPDRGDVPQQVVDFPFESHEDLSSRKYRKDLEKWASNVDQGRAWIALLGFWLVGFSITGPYRIYGLIYAEVTRLNTYTREQASQSFAYLVTAEFLSSTIVSLIISRGIQARYSILIGGLLCALGNGLAGFSRLLMLDIICIGLIQGVGFAFVFVPFMNLVNSYFDKYRNMAFGLALAGGTMSIFLLVRPFQWLLANYPWRYAYFGLSLINMVSVVAFPLLRPNPKPQPPARLEQVDKKKAKPSYRKLMLEILKTPAFYLITSNMFIHFWILGIIVLVIVDYGSDKGCSKLEAQNLVVFESSGELTGRLLLTTLADMRLFPRLRYLVPLVLFLEAVILSASTQVHGYLPMATVAFTIMSINAFLYILTNSLFVAHLGEEKVTSAYAMASFLVGLIMIFRPQVIGFFRDHWGSYDGLMWSLAGACALVATCWLLKPIVPRLLCRHENTMKQEEEEVN